MTDQFKDDEYHFSDDDNSQDFDGGFKDNVISKVAEDPQLKRYILMAVGGFVVILFTYKFLGNLLSSGPKKKMVTQSNVTQPKRVTQAKPVKQPKLMSKSKPVPQELVTSTAKPIAPTTKALTPPKVDVLPPTDKGISTTKKVVDVQSTPKETKMPVKVVKTKPASQIAPSVQPIQPAVVSQLEKLQTLSHGVRNDVNSLSANVANLKSDYRQLMTKMDELSDRVAGLNDSLYTQKQQLASLKEKRRVRKQAMHRKKTVVRTPYFIQAIIPGRAWLKSSRGKTMTVSEGSLVAGYGRVKLIDVHQGQVLTSSGAIIRFSPTDV